MKEVYSIILTYKTYSMLTGYLSATGGNCAGALSFIEQPDSALVAIRLCMGLLPAILVLMGLLLMRGWPDRGAHLHKAAG